MISIDPLLDSKYSDNYNCLDFARDAWNYLTGDSVGKVLENGIIRRSELRHFRLLPSPVSPCFVVFKRTNYVPHVGIYYDGRILHLTAHGVLFQIPRVAKLYFSEFVYYA